MKNNDVDSINLLFSIGTTVALSSAAAFSGHPELLYLVPIISGVGNSLPLVKDIFNLSTKNKDISDDDLTKQLNEYLVEAIQDTRDNIAIPNYKNHRQQSDNN
ncbi:MAG: hypothetical protein JXN65_06635 [Clostridia bacterium]|nr:hypothetical protein [Clostridia bacterium]